jgi:endonuclease/exonuclease/phosphatase family metal-dependent hydrolase
LAGREAGGIPVANQSWAPESFAVSPKSGARVTPRPTTGTSIQSFAKEESGFKEFAREAKMKQLSKRLLSLAIFAPAMLALAVAPAWAQTPEAPAVPEKPAAVKAEPASTPAPLKRAPVPSADDAIGMYRIASYNAQLLFDDKDDPNTEDEQFGSKSPESLTALAGVIMAMDAEIVGLQEVENREAVQWFLDTYMPDSGYTLYMDEPPGSLFNVALLSKFPVERIVRYGDSNSGAGGETFRYLRHRIVAFEVAVNPDYKVWTLVCHLKAMSDPRSQNMRADMAKAVRDFLENTLGLNPREDNIAIIGDFNDTPESRALQILTGDKAYIDTGKMAQAIELTHPSNEPSRQIDYVVISWGLSAELLPDAFRIPPLPSLDMLTRASDHLPVMSVFMDRDTGPTGAERRDMFNMMDPGQKARYINIIRLKNASDIIAEKRREQLASALSSEGDPTPVAEARANFLKLEKEGKGNDSPVVFVEGVAQSEGMALGGNRVQFGFADASGTILVDAPNTEHFDRIPQDGDFLRMVGKVIRYRDILEFRPLAPTKYLKALEVEVETPTFSVAEFNEKVDPYQGGRVNLGVGEVIDIYERRNGAVKYTVRSIEPGSDATAIIYVTQNLTKAPPKARQGQLVRASGIVSSYDSLPQLLPAAADEFEIVPRNAIAPATTPEPVSTPAVAPTTKPASETAPASEPAPASRPAAEKATP